MPNFMKLIDKYAFGHVCPKHQLVNLDESMIRQVLEKNSVDDVILDWKGLGPEKNRIVTLLKEMKIEFKRADLI
jgi:D-tyrosyl-tRNA(Tyr) deacylase